MKSATMRTNAASLDKEMLAFITKTQAIIQTSLQQELWSDLHPKSKFKPKALTLGSLKTESAGTVFREYLTKNFKKAEQGAMLRQVSRKNRRSLSSGLKPSSVCARGINPIPAYANVKSSFNLLDKKSIITQLDLKSEYNGIDLKRLFDNSNALSILRDSALLEFLHNRPTTTPNKALRFNLHEVKCITRTSELGDDEISAAAVTVNDTGSTGIVSEFVVRRDFVARRVKDFNPPRLIQKFSLSSNQTYPKSFTVFFNLVEKDLGGGFSDFMTRLHEAIDTEVKTIISLLGGAIGATIAPPYGAAVGALIGIATGIILDAVIRELAARSKDDPFTTGGDYAAIDLPTSDFTFDGSLQGPIVAMHHYNPKDQGHYRIKYNWSLKQ